MSWDTVPWFVGGGAEHSPEVARLMAYVAFRGNEGVLAPGDLKASALAVPGGAVRVAPGACSILNRASGGTYQAYAGRLPSEETGVTIAPTGAGSGRSDLIVARVEDPFMSGEPWADPEDARVGPYIFTRVIPNVPVSTTSVVGLGLGYSAIPLARVDIPASTGAITQAMITDLRKVANPRRERRLMTAAPTSDFNLTASSYTPWPAPAAWAVAVPAWATRARVTLTVAGAQGINGNVFGAIRARLGTLATGGVVYDLDLTSAASVRTTVVAADTLNIPAAMRGTTATLLCEGSRSTGPGNLQADGGTTVVADIEFEESAA